MRRSFLDQHRLRYDEDMRLGEDYAFMPERSPPAPGIAWRLPRDMSRLCDQTRSVPGTASEILSGCEMRIAN